MTVRETSKALGLKVRTVREWISTGRLPATKVGKAYVIDESVVYSEEVQERASKGREHSKRIEAGIAMGMLAGRSEDSEESTQRAEC